MKATRRVSVVLIVAVAALAVLWWFYEGRYHVWQVRFNPAAWKEADPKSRTSRDGYRTVRSHMIEDLLQRYRFDGWTRQQVIGLLGQPTGPWAGFEQWDMIFVLGLERGGAYSLDDEALGFKFGSTDRVVRYGLSVN